MSDYAFREYEESDIDAALDLFRACYGTERSRELWLWLYHSGPWGQASVVCADGKDIVGFYGVLLRNLYLDGNATLSGHVMDVMTHPNHQRKGLFVEAARTAFGIARSKKVAQLFGYPNKMALPGHRKTGWNELGTSPILLHPIEPGESAEFIEKGLADNRRVELDLRRRFEDISVRAKTQTAVSKTELVMREMTWDAVGSASSEFDRLFRRNIARYRMIGDRSAKWLLWRYGKKPNFRYVMKTVSSKDGELAAWVVARERAFQGKRIGHIVDFLGDPDNTEASVTLIRDAIDSFGDSGCVLLQFLRSAPNFTRQVEDLGWYVERERALLPIIRGTDDERLTTARMNLDDWYMTLGDCDVF